jgi:hypothetical protein
MTGVNSRAVRQYHQLGVNATEQLTVAATGEVSSAYSEVEQGIPGEYYPMPDEADATRGMARGMNNQKVQVANINAVPTFKQPVRGIQAGIGSAKYGTYRLFLNEPTISSVNTNRSFGGFLDLPQGTNMVNMAVGQHDKLYVKSQLIHTPQNLPGIGTGVNYHPLLG